jgi:hypothetical protein
MFDFDFELYDLTLEELKEQVYEEMLLYHSEEARKKYEKNKEEFPMGILNAKGKERKKLGKKH